MWKKVLFGVGALAVIVGLGLLIFFFGFGTKKQVAAVAPASEKKSDKKKVIKDDPVRRASAAEDAEIEKINRKIDLIEKRSKRRAKQMQLTVLKEVDRIITELKPADHDPNLFEE